jgi:site-specific recombinase XerD
MQELAVRELIVETFWIDEFETYLINEGKAHPTIQAYGLDVRLFAAWYAQVNGEEFDISVLTRFDLRAYRIYALDDRRVKPATWNRWRASLMALCGWAVAAGILNQDPSMGLEAARVVEMPPRWLERSQVNRLMRQAERLVNGAGTKYGRWQAVRDQAILALMVYAGLRESELIGLDVDDVEVGERKGRVIVRQGKGGKYREVPLSKEARYALGMWLEVRGADPGVLFWSKRGGGLTRRAVIHRVKEIGRLADVQVSPHDLRHTCAKRMLDEGAPLTVVQKVLGHSRLDTTARYVTPGWGDLERAVESI